MDLYPLRVVLSICVTCVAFYVQDYSVVATRSRCPVESVTMKTVK